MSHHYYYYVFVLLDISFIYRNNLTVVDALIVSGKGATSNLYVKEAITVEDDECDEGAEPEEEDVMSSGWKTKEPQHVLHYEIKEGSLKSCIKSGSPGEWCTIELNTCMSQKLFYEDMHVIMKYIYYHCKSLSEKISLQLVHLIN